MRELRDYAAHNHGRIPSKAILDRVGITQEEVKEFKLEQQAQQERARYEASVHTLEGMKDRIASLQGREHVKELTALLKQKHIPMADYLQWQNERTAGPAHANDDAPAFLRPLGQIIGGIAHAFIPN